LLIGWSSTKFSFFVQYGIQDGGYGMTWFNIGPYEKNVLKDIWGLTYQRRKQKTTPTNDKMTAVQYQPFFAYFCHTIKKSF
jgi:hypothetical protein